MAKRHVTLSNANVAHHPYFGYATPYAVNYHCDTPDVGGTPSFGYTYQAPYNPDTGDRLDPGEVVTILGTDEYNNTVYVDFVGNVWPDADLFCTGAGSTWGYGGTSSEYWPGVGTLHPNIHPFPSGEYRPELPCPGLGDGKTPPAYWGHGYDFEINGQYGMWTCRYTDIPHDTRYYSIDSESLVVTLSDTYYDMLTGEPKEGAPVDQTIVVPGLPEDSDKRPYSVPVETEADPAGVMLAPNGQAQLVAATPLEMMEPFFTAFAAMYDPVTGEELETGKTATYASSSNAAAPTASSVIAISAPEEEPVEISNPDSMKMAVVAPDWQAPVVAAPQNYPGTPVSYSPSTPTEATVGQKASWTNASSDKPDYIEADFSSPFGGWYGGTKANAPGYGYSGAPAPAAGYPPGAWVDDVGDTAKSLAGALASIMNKLDDNHHPAEWIDAVVEDPTMADSITNLYSILAAMVAAGPKPNGAYYLSLEDFETAKTEAQNIYSKAPSEAPVINDSSLSALITALDKGMSAVDDVTGTNTDPDGLEDFELGNDDTPASGNQFEGLAGLIGTWHANMGEMSFIEAAAISGSIDTEADAGSSDKGSSGGASDTPADWDNTKTGPFGSGWGWGGPGDESDDDGDEDSGDWDC